MHDGLEQAALVKHHIVRDAHLQEGDQLILAAGTGPEAHLPPKGNTHIQVPSSKTTKCLRPYTHSHRTGLISGCIMSLGGLPGKEECFHLILLLYHMALL